MIFSLIIVLSFNVYALWLLPSITFSDLVYWDVLVLSVWLSVFLVGFFRKKVRLHRIGRCLREPGPIAPLFLPYIDQEVYFHDVDRLQDELEQERCRNSELKDGIDRIVHELKASLATLSLCQGQADQDTTRLVIETMNRQLGFLLLQSRLETSVMDVQFQKSDLRSLIGTAIKNNKYLLIRSRFEIRIDCPPLSVYTDPEWLIYVLDQLLMNAIKYRRDPLIEIRAFQDENETVIEFKDHGIGIESRDLLQVFEKGFTGGNTRSGTYRSTGMGLYFVRTVMDRLSGSVEVQSAAGSYTLFTLRLFNDARMTWLRKKMDHTDL